MVRHIIIWNFADGFTDQENKDNAKRVKEELENLINLIEGIVSIKVSTDPLPSSNGDMCLNSLFESQYRTDV